MVGVAVVVVGATSSQWPLSLPTKVANFAALVQMQWPSKDLGTIGSPNLNSGLCQS